MHKIKNRLENELTITKVTNDSMEFEIRANGKINFNQWFGDKPLSQQYHNDEQTLGLFLQEFIARHVFDADAGLEDLVITKLNASSELYDAFKVYATKYLELKGNRENEAKTKEIQDLENRLNELKRA